MYKEHLSFEKPENENCKVWRYMDFTKFVSLLANKSLFFTRIDKFRDCFEGVFPQQNTNVEVMKTTLVWRNIMNQQETKINDKMLMSIIDDKQEYNALLRERTAVSCWHMNEYESAAMWDLYLRSNEGVAIQTTFHNLIESFNVSDKEIYVGKVQYIDFNSEYIPLENDLNALLYKRKSFEHEKEIRALYPGDGVHDEDGKLKKPSFAYGIDVEIDVDKLIENVYVHPDAPSWFYNLVTSVMETYQFEKTVVHSNLYELPK